MGFIEIRRYYDRRNQYKIMPLTMNPYVLLSEYVHWNRQVVLSNWENVEAMFEQVDALSYSAHAYTEASLTFVNQQKYYLPFIERIRVAYGEQFYEQYEEIIKDVGQKISELYNLMYQRLNGRR